MSAGPAQAAWQRTGDPAVPTAAPVTPQLLYLLSGDPAELAAVTASLRSADLAAALNALPPEGVARVMAALPFDVAVRVLDQPDLARRDAAFECLDRLRAGALVEAMAPDQQVDLFRTLPERVRARLFRALTPGTRERLRRLLAYPPDAAGGIMTTELLTVPATWTVAEVREYLRDVGDIRETVHPIFILDPVNQRLLRVVSPLELLIADPDRGVGRVGQRREPISVGPLADRDEVARVISKYNLPAVPVVDDRRRVIGMVTVDDVIDVLVEQHAERVQRFGGMEALDGPYMGIGLMAMVKKRAGWLCALFLSEMLTATAMGHFEGEISRAVVLALFIPLIISSGGNSGSQATSLIIRAMALREVRLRDWWRVAAREMPAGLILGVILGTIGFARIVLWQRLGWYDYGTHYLSVAATVATALVGVVGFGSLAGSMLPFALRRLGFDPASASAPFVATLVDVTGLVIYFTVALLMLRGVLL
jgi:magnesium transporter